MSAKVVVSASLSSGYTRRYVVVDDATGDVPDDAQGYGYKTARNAHAHTPISRCRRRRSINATRRNDACNASARSRQQAEGDLDRQVGRLQDFHDGLAVFTDVASGLSDRRAGLRKALSECMTPGVDRLLVEHRDRLAHLGVVVIEHLLAGFGVEVIYTGQPREESAESELVRDMLAIVTSFADRLYGDRSATTRRLRAAVAAETECGDAA